MTYYNQSKILTEFKAKLDNDMNYLHERTQEQNLPIQTATYTQTGGNVKHDVSPRFHTWDKTKDTFCFLSSLSTQSKPVLPVDDTSIIIYHPKSGHFRIVLMVFFPSWTSGLKQTNFSYTWQNIFATNNISSINLNTCHDLKIIEVVTKFLGLQTDDNLNYNWNNIPKFNQALWWQQSR